MGKEEQERLADLITGTTTFCTKEVLTTYEAAQYMDISLGFLYHLTKRHLIPHFKPRGKCYFNRLEIEQWLQKNRVSVGNGLTQEDKNKKEKEEQKRLADLTTANTTFYTKEVLTTREAAEYMDTSVNCLYTLMHQIPHGKFMGKVCYFNRLELDQWLQRNRVPVDNELTQEDKETLYKSTAF